MIRTRPLLGGLVTAAVAAFVLAAYGDSSEGTVVAKTGQWGVCSVPKCWRLVVRNIDGTRFEPCVSREEYDRMQLGAYWHGRTDR